MLAHAGSVISESTMAENVGVAAGGTSRALSVQQLFSLTLCIADTLSFECQQISDHVGSHVCVTAMSAVKRGGYVEVSFVFVIQADITCIYADFNALTVFRPPYWICGKQQIQPECAIL